MPRAYSTPHRRLAPILLLLLVMTSGRAQADEITMSNGDRLTGKILRMEQNVLTLQTNYAGDIKVDWHQIRRITAESPLSVTAIGETDDGDLLHALFYSNHAVHRVTELGTEGSPGLADVHAINLDPIRLTGTLSVGGNSTQGNSETKAFNGAARLTLATDRQRLLLEAKYNYGQAGEQVTARNSLASVKHDYFVQPRVFIESFGMLEKDTLQNLQLRTTLGSGVGYQFLETSRTTLSLSVGLAYVNEHFTTSPGHSTPSGRWSLRWEHALWPDRVKFFHRHEGFWDLTEGNAIRLNADQGLRVTVYKNLFFNVEYDIRLNTQPAPGRKALDESAIFGVGYELR